jgi:hypothetical protein|tara:strand:- start:24478 stop:25206 length:729 start_codon:yes stop_codon:yes gene_type:complete
MATATAAAAAHTPMINKDSYVTASFIDNDRKTLEVLVRHHENKNEMTPLIIEASEDQQDFKDLMEFVTMDQLHEQTWENKKAESEAFIAMAKNIAKDAFSEAEAVANVAVDEAEIFSRTKIYPTIVDTLFTNMENEDHLFALKLALFEVQEIRESTDTKAKTALRKGKNKIDVLRHAFDICGVRQTQSDVPSVSTPAENDAAIKTLDATPQATDGVSAAVTKVARPTTVVKKKAGTSKKKKA